MGNKVSLNQIIGNVIGNLRITDTNNIKDDFARWACEAENKIGSEQSYKRHECELVIHNRKAALPPNFIYLHALKYGNLVEKKLLVVDSLEVKFKLVVLVFHYLLIFYLEVYLLLQMLSL